MTYTPEQNAALADALDGIPATSMVVRVVEDYIALRDQCKARQKVLG